MTTEQKLSFFQELINCSYPLYHWEYDSSMNLLSSNWTKELFSGDFFSYIGFHKLIQKHISDGNQSPVILEAGYNLIWIAGFEFRDMQLHRCYFIGPVLSGRDSHMKIRKRLDAYELSAKLRFTIFKTFEEIPSIPNNIVTQYAVMLHYCLNHEKVVSGDVRYLNPYASDKDTAVRTDTSTHTGIWVNEQKLLKMISEGDPHYKEALQQSLSLSYGVKAEFGDPIRSHKNNSLVLLTLCSRACIEGGLSPTIAYDLNDYYAKRIEECKSLTDTTNLCSEMLEDFVARVREAKEQESVSGLIQNACEYIKNHLTEPLSIKVLAHNTGYSEYYFSHKFKKEMGCSVNDYILQNRLEQAKLLLAGTNDSIQTISDNLSFSNRSYFYTCFTRHVGISPSEYRRKNGKL